MADGSADVQLDSDTASDDDHFESDFDDSVSSVNDRLGSSDAEVTQQQQTTSAVDDAETLSDRQVLDAVHTLLKVGKGYFSFVITFAKEVMFLLLCLSLNRITRKLFKSNQIFICSNERSKKIDNNSDDEQDSKAQEALTAALVLTNFYCMKNSLRGRNASLPTNYSILE